MTWPGYTKFEINLMKAAARIKYERRRNNDNSKILTNPTDPYLGTVLGTIPIAADNSIPLGEFVVRNDIIYTSKDSTEMFISEKTRAGEFEE